MICEVPRMKEKKYLNNKHKGMDVKLSKSGIRDLSTSSSCSISIGIATNNYLNLRNTFFPSWVSVQMHRMINYYKKRHCIIQALSACWVMTCPVLQTRSLFSLFLFSSPLSHLIITFFLDKDFVCFPYVSLTSFNLPTLVAVVFSQLQFC